MVIGFLKIESAIKVKNNHFYGDYEVKTELSRTIVNEKCVGLVYPKNGIVVTIKTIDDEKITFTISKHYFTGEDEKEVDESIGFSTSFTYGGHVYEIEVDANGQLISLDEWYNLGQFEDGETPDNHYRKNTRGISWKLIEM